MILVLNCDNLGELRQKLINGDEVMAKPVEEGDIVYKDFKEYTDNELSEYLKEYAKNRSGEIADLTYAASVRIATLAARLQVLEDDRK